MDSPNLIDAFNYYLVLAFAVSTVLRARNYRAILGVIYRSSARWPPCAAPGRLPCGRGSSGRQSAQPFVVVGSGRLGDDH